jgi:hypothetical protein
MAPEASSNAGNSALVLPSLGQNWAEALTIIELDDFCINFLDPS